MRERKTISFLLAAMILLPYGGAVCLMDRWPSSYVLLLPAVGWLASFFGVVYLLASEKSWHAVLCGLAGALGLLWNTLGFFYLGYGMDLP